MKYLLLFSLLFLGFGANAQFKTLTLKSGTAYRYTRWSDPRQIITTVTVNY